MNTDLPTARAAVDPRVFRQGARVTWKGRTARVKYVRMLPPEFARPMAYCIVLDDQLARPSYTGTIVPAHEVHRALDNDSPGEV